MFHPRANEMAAWPRRAHDLEAPGRTSATRAEPPGLHMPEITLRKEARFRDPSLSSVAGSRVFMQYVLSFGCSMRQETGTLWGFLHNTKVEVTIEDDLDACKHQL